MICKEVAAISCPMGTEPVEYAFHLFNGRNRPGNIPGSSIPVRPPRPNTGRRLIEPCVSHPLADLGHANVAGLDQDVNDRKPSVFVVIMQDAAGHVVFAVFRNREHRSRLREHPCAWAPEQRRTV